MTYLVDFGQAKRYQRPTVPGLASALTDQRSDEYSLAATIYALLMGAPPPSSQDRLLFNVGIPSMSSARPDVSPRVEYAIFRALSLDASDRYKDVSSFRRALRA
jgi:serine/threonine-protein kinase